MSCVKRLRDELCLHLSNARHPLAFRKIKGETLTRGERAKLMVLNKLLDFVSEREFPRRPSRDFLRERDAIGRFIAKYKRQDNGS